MKSLILKSVSFALGAVSLPAVLAAQSYLPLPHTSAPVYQPVSHSYYDSTPDQNVTGSSLVNRVATPPDADPESVPSPSDTSLPVDSNGDYMNAMSSDWSGAPVKSGKGVCCGGSCWNGCYYGGAYAMWLRRDGEQELQCTVLSTNERDAILNNYSAAMGTGSGYGINIGKVCGNGCFGVEVGWWSVNPGARQAEVRDPDGAGPVSLITAFDFSTLDYLGNDLDTYFDGADAHRLTRDWDFQSLELNLAHFSAAGCLHGHAYEVNTLLGFRYMQVDESFLYQSDPNGFDFSAADTLSYYINCQNRLFGLQAGGRGTYYVTNNFALNLTTKVGLLYNNVGHTSYIGGAAGPAVVGSGPNAGDLWDIRVSDSKFSMLGEFDLGGSYQFGNHWRLTAGYRVFGLSGLAMTRAQVPFDFRDTTGVAQTNMESSLILHGGYAGAEFIY